MLQHLFSLLLNSNLFIILFSSFFSVAYVHSTRRMTAPRWPPQFSLPGSRCGVYPLYVYGPRDPESFRCSWTHQTYLFPTSSESLQMLQTSNSWACVFLPLGSYRDFEVMEVTLALLHVELSTGWARPKKPRVWPVCRALSGSGLKTCGRVGL